MVTPPVAATVPGVRRDLVKLFVQHGFSGFPVVKEGSRKLVGVVTRQHIFNQPDEDQVALLMDPNPATTYAAAPLREAARLMSERELRTLPVVNASNDLVGVLTPLELLPALPPRGLVSSHLRRRRLVPVYRATPVRVALEILRTTGARALPVLDDAGRLAGLVTDSDLLKRARVTDTIIRTVTGSAADTDEWTWDRVRDERRLQHATTRIDLPTVAVDSVMVRPVISCSPTTTLREAAQKMVEARIGQLPVVEDEGRVVGLLTDIDVLAALAS